MSKKKILDAFTRTQRSKQLSSSADAYTTLPSTDRQNVLRDLDQLNDDQLESVICDAVVASMKNGLRSLSTSTIAIPNWGQEVSDSKVESCLRELRSGESFEFAEAWRITCLEINSRYVCAHSFEMLIANRVAGTHYVQAFVIPTKGLKLPLPTRVYRTLSEVCFKRRWTPVRQSLLAQCLKVKKVYDEIKTQKEREREINKRKLSVRPTLPDVAKLLFPGWPRNLGRGDVSFLLMPSRSTVEWYWTNIKPLLESKDVIKKLYDLESRGLITPWTKSNLSCLRKYSCNEVQQQVDSWIEQKAYLRSGELTFKKRETTSAPQTLSPVAPASIEESDGITTGDKSTTCQNGCKVKKRKAETAIGPEQAISRETLSGKRSKSITSQREGEVAHGTNVVVTEKDEQTPAEDIVQDEKQGTVFKERIERLHRELGEWKSSRHDPKATMKDCLKIPWRLVEELKCILAHCRACSACLQCTHAEPFVP